MQKHPREDEVLMSVSSDASASYRGYRLQTLYTLRRMLDVSDNENLIFQPEGKEDLAVYDTDHNLIEVVQVKALGAELFISSFSPQKPNSFFYRASDLLKENSNLNITVVSFGKIGAELLRSIETEGDERKRVAEKLSNYGLLSKTEAKTLLSTLRIIPLNETDVKEDLDASFKSGFTGIDPDSAFEILMFWLYVCAENKTEITKKVLIDKLNNIGKFFVARSSFYKEWFTSIVPIEDRKILEDDKAVLSQEFYEGISAKYEHILANLDILRPKKIHKIAEKFELSKVVIIHGASGQGKTTLAYRFLREFYPEFWRFQVQLVENRQHALSVAKALVSHADAIDVPMIVFVDVLPKDVDWPELVKQLADHRTIRVLVTIREEDFRRSNISGVEFRFSDIELNFDLSEARELYQSLEETRMPARILDFEDAWNKFGGKGPLLEFVHLVTQGLSLKQRLTQQINRIEDEVREGKRSEKEFELIRLVSVASAYEARLKTMPLAKHMGLLSPRRTFETLEKEYFIRVSKDGALVQGLHPIRSNILAELLTEPTLFPWASNAGMCLEFMQEEDIATFLIHSFSRHHADSESFLAFVAEFKPNRWVALSGVATSLIWLGILEYTKGNQQLIKEAYNDSGSGWHFVMDFDIADIGEGLGGYWWKSLATEERALQIEAFQARQTDKRKVFEYAKNWLSKQNQKPLSPVSDSDWAAVGRVVFWIGRLGISWPLSEWLPDSDLNIAINALPIEELSNLILGLSQGYGESFNPWLEKNRSGIVDRFRNESQTVALEDNGEKITAHFILKLDQEEDYASDSESYSQEHKDFFNEEAMQRLSILRKLFPDRSKFASQGYGHKLWPSFTSLNDSTVKSGIPSSHLPPYLLTSINSTFRGLGEMPQRLMTWDEYTQKLLSLRKDVLYNLKQAVKGLSHFFRKRKPIKLLGNLVDNVDWSYCQQVLQKPPLLPRCAVDEWGFVDEYTSGLPDQKSPEKSPNVNRKGLAIKKYKPFLKAYGEYIRTLSNFFAQSIHAMSLNPYLGRASNTGADKAKLEEVATQQGINLDMIRLSNLNLTDAIKNLSVFQNEFRSFLGKRVSTNELDWLEHQEKDVFQSLLMMWYFFIFHPAKIMQNALNESSKRFKEIVRKIRNNLQKQCKIISSEALQITVMAEDILWENNPALWLQIDGRYPIDVYNSLEQVFAAIPQAVQRVDNRELGNFAAQLRWNYVVIVPLVRGKCLDATAWHVSLPVLLSNKETNELGWWNLVQQPIPQDAWAKLGLEIWKAPQFEFALRFLNSTAELSLLAAHIGDFERLPELDNLGLELLQSHIHSVSAKMANAFEASQKAAADLINIFEKVSETEYDHRPNLMAAMQALNDGWNNVSPVSDFNGKVTLDLEELVEWAKRLENAREKAFMVYLFWVADVLDEMDV